MNHERANRVAMDRVAKEILSSKVLDYLVSNAQITEAKGE